jgi:hypothetical protein
MAPFFFLIAIRAIDLPLCNFHGPFVSTAEGRDISCKCGLINLQIECCNVVKESKEMNIHCPGDYVAFKLLLTETLVVRDCLSCVHGQGVSTSAREPMRQVRATRCLVVKCLVGQSDTLSLSSLMGCSLRNSSTVVISYESNMKSTPEEQKRSPPWALASNKGSTKTLYPERVVILYDCHKMV